MNAAEHVELLDALVPLCGGIPLALTVLGKIFVDERKRKKSKWEVIKKKMQDLDGEDGETSRVTKYLRLSYDTLTTTRKEVFMDVVNFYYGWPWGAVKRILGVSVLKDLKNSSLISKADNWSKCNQSALRRGFSLVDDDWAVRRGFSLSDDDDWETLLREVVTMHDLILKFGEGLGTRPKVTITDFKGPLQDLEAPCKLRNLIWWGDHEPHDSELEEFLRRTANLQMLFLRQNVENRKIENYEAHDSANLPMLFFRQNVEDRKIEKYENVLEADGITLDTAPSLRGGLQRLRFLRLDGWKSSRLILEMKLTCEIREIHLRNCPDVVHLPDTPLPQLEQLRIYDCQNFLGFSNLCVEQWHKLQHLEVNLCKKLKGLPSAIGNALSLQTLDVSWCVSLVELPDELGKLTSLTRLAVSGCKNLKGLPSAIGNALSLQTLEVSWCESLVELPDELGKLTSLTDLDASGCRNLKGLPSAIGNALSLRILDVSGCESLVELPDELGKLTSLTWLDASSCKNLKGLPSAIGNALSLKLLKVSGCENLVELPDELGKLTSLTYLDASCCKNLKGLPLAIGNALSLKRLKVSGCENLIELPDELRKLTLE